MPLSSMSWGGLMERPHFQSTWFHNNPTTEKSHSGISDLQLHFREPGNLQSQLRPGVSELKLPRRARNGQKLLFSFLRGKKSQTNNTWNSAREKHFTPEKLKFQNFFFSRKFWSLLPRFQIWQCWSFP